jgi:hypothetical protein
VKSPPGIKNTGLGICQKHSKVPSGLGGCDGASEKKGPPKILYARPCPQPGHECPVYKMEALRALSRGIFFIVRVTVLPENVSINANFFPGLIFV